MTDLTDRMRTCAAYMLDEAGPGETEMQWQAIYRAAADLLIEASNALEAAPPPLGEPMAIIKQKVDEIAAEVSTWIAPGGTLPGVKRSGTISPRACPKCDSRAGKTVRRIENKMMLVCPACGETWEFKR